MHPSTARCRAGRHQTFGPNAGPARGSMVQCRTRHVKVSVSHPQSDFGPQVRRTKALAKVRSTAKGNANLPDTTHRRGRSPHMLVKHNPEPMWSG